MQGKEIKQNRGSTAVPCSASINQPITLKKGKGSRNAVHRLTKPKRIDYRNQSQTQTTQNRPTGKTSSADLAIDCPQWPTCTLSTAKSPFFSTVRNVGPST